MAQNFGNAHQDWIGLAEKAIKRRDYESAARFFRYVSIYFGLINDMANRRKFAVKTGECYLQAARELGSGDDRLEVILLCIKADDSFHEGRSVEQVRLCDSLIRKYYASIVKDGLTKVHGDAHGLKGIGDYFVKTGDFESAIECYRAAAEKASEDEKLALSGGLYRDVGDCYRRLKGLGNAAESYATAADMYFKCQEYFEAAWHYCDSGFLFIYVGRLEEASTIARKAGLACGEGHIDVLLNDLSHVCRLLSERAISEAENRWNRIRMKFKRNYINLIDSCFQALRET